jgi:uncharacterized RDD family membrane protein YckC
VSSVAPGWYKDPADPSTQRYWDGEGWLGEAIAADATPPAGPPPTPRPSPLLAQTAHPAGEPVRVERSATAPPAAPAAPPAPSGGAATQPGAAGPTLRPVPVWPPGLPPYLIGASPRPHGLALASPGRRLVARMVDFLAVLTLVVIADAWFAYRWWQVTSPVLNEIFNRVRAGNSSTADLPTPPAEASALILMIIVVMTAVWFAYEVPSSANSGQTLGKRLLGIKVVRLESEERLGLRRSFRRWGRLGLPTLLWYCYGFGFALQFIDCLFVLIDRPLRQALHDKSAFTVVVRVRRRHAATPGRTMEKARGGTHADSR